MNPHDELREVTIAEMTLRARRREITRQLRKVREKKLFLLLAEDGAMPKQKRRPGWKQGGKAKRNSVVSSGKVRSRATGRKRKGGEG